MAFFEFFKGLIDLGAGVHDEGAMADDGFVQGFSVHEEELGVALGVDGDAVAVALEDDKVAFAGVAFVIDGDETFEDEEGAGVTFWQGQADGFVGVEADVPEIDGGVGLGCTRLDAILAGDDAEAACIIGKGDGGDVFLKQCLVAGRGAFVLGAEIDPELDHLQISTVTGEVLGVEFFMDDAFACGHPLDIPWADFATSTAGVAVL